MEVSIDQARGYAGDMAGHRWDVEMYRKGFGVETGGEGAVG